MQIDQQDPVKLLVTFSSDVNLDEVTVRLQESYVFIQMIKKYGNSLLISFDCMSDLLEIDFIGEFGALQTQVKNSNSFCKEMNEKSSQEVQLSTSFEISFISEPSKDGVFNSSKVYKRTNKNEVSHQRERLTSLQDEIIEQQQLQKKFALFDYNLEHQNYVWQKQLSESIGKQKIVKFQDEPNQGQKKPGWGNLIGGVLITSLIVGGVKALRFFMG